MANKRRGEVEIILNDKPYILCLTFGALAELEDKLQLGNIGELAAKFAEGRVKSSDLICILGAALRAGGANLSDEEAATMRCEGGAASLTRAVVELLRLTFSLPDSEAENAENRNRALHANPS